MVNEQTLGMMNRFMLKQWWDSLTADKCGCYHLEYAVDDNDGQIYSVCVGWHDADGKSVIAWKIGRQSSICATQYDFDLGFETLRDPESGETGDAIETIETEPADWSEIIKTVAKRIAKAYVDKGVKKDEDENDEDENDEPNEANEPDEADEANEGELVFTDDLEVLNETSLRYQQLWLRDRQDSCGNIEFARNGRYRYCVCLGYHDEDGTKRLAWKIGRIRTDEQKKFGFDTGYKTVNDSLVVIDKGFSDWGGLVEEMRNAIAVFKDSRMKADAKEDA